MSQPHNTEYVPSCRSPTIEHKFEQGLGCQDPTGAAKAQPRRPDLGACDGMTGGIVTDEVCWCKDLAMKGEKGKSSDRVLDA